MSIDDTKSYALRSLCFGSLMKFETFKAGVWRQRGGRTYAFDRYLRLFFG